jgi:hypothetical protein
MRGGVLGDDNHREQYQKGDLVAKSGNANEAEDDT